MHKSDQRDAQAVAEATSRSQVAAVRVKSEAAQATHALMRVRERRIRQRVQTANQWRGLLSASNRMQGPQRWLESNADSDIVIGAPARRNEPSAGRYADPILARPDTRGSERPNT